MHPHKRSAEEIYRDFQDHAIFCRESLTIPDEQGVVVPFDMGPAAIKLRVAIQRQRDAGKPIRIIYLKARRVRVSAATAAEIFHGTPFIAGQHAVVIAHDEETALNLHKFYTHFAEHYKPFGDVIRLPAQSKAPEGTIEWANGSWINIATARNVNFGRSFNLRRVQFDEFAFYNNPAKLMTAVMAAVPKDPETMVIIPSTANGVGNEFHKLWLRATDPTIESEWIAVFCAWWEHAGNVMSLSIPADRFQASLDREEQQIQQTYRLSLEQLNWRRWVIENDFRGDKQMFRQEHPGCPEEAFIASGRLRFDAQAIGRLPVHRGELVRGGLEVQQVGLEKRVVFVARENGELTLFRKPERGSEYIIGADTSEGIDVNEGNGEADSDYSVAHVLDRHNGDQVAVLRERLQPSALGEYLHWLGLYYNWAGIVPEVNGIGIGTVDELLRQGYPPGRIYHRLKQPDEDPFERSDNIGWKTTTVTRQQLLSKLDTALREGALLVHDPVTVQELMTFVIKPNGKAEHNAGCHDDTVIALGLAVVGIEQMPRWTPPGKHEPLEVKNYRRRGEPEARGRRVRIL